MSLRGPNNDDRYRVPFFDCDALCEEDLRRKAIERAEAANRTPISDEVTLVRHTIGYMDQADLSAELVVAHVRVKALPRPAPSYIEETLDGWFR